MDDLIQDLKYSFRQIIGTPLVSAVAASAIALGIGVNTAIFSMVNTMVLKPLPYSDSQQLLFIMESRANTSFQSVGYLNYRDWQEQNQSFEHMALVRGQTYALAGDQEPVRLMGAQASANLFLTLGVEPMLGRSFEPADDRPAAVPVAILSYGLWQRYWSGSRSIIGQSLTLNNVSYIVVGVLPQEFRWFLQSQSPEIWTPIGLWSDTEMLSQRRNRSGMNVIARLRRGVTVEEAGADLSRIARSLERQYPETNSGSGIRITSLQERIVGDVRAPLMILLGAVSMVLLIACANVANLLMARATVRAKEIAVRISLGAGRGRLIRQLLTESVVLALIGGIVGVLLAHWSMDMLTAASLANLPRIDEVRIDRSVLAFSALLALLSGCVFGLAPALASSKPDLNRSLKDSARGSTAQRHRIRDGLVVAEVALVLVLLAGAGLLIKSFWRLQSESPGFNPDRVLTAQVVLSGSSYPNPDARRAFYRRLRERLQALPGAPATAIVNPLPVSGTGWQTRFMIEGRPRPKAGEFPTAEWMQVSPEYFRTMQIPLLRGRTFTELDREDAPPVTIVDEAFTRRHFAGEDPLGRRLAYGDADHPVWCEIVGVVAHVKINGVAEEAGIQLYVPYLQGSYAPMTVLIRTSNGPQEAATAARNILKGIDPGLPLYNVRMMDELLDNTVSERRLAMLLLSAFAVLALVLVTLGIYGVMAFTVGQRTHEIGIRMALGARRAGVLALVVRRGMTWVSIGLAVGLAATFGLTRLLRSLLFSVEPTDPLILGTVPVFLALVALAACYLPARRAAGVDPLLALRSE